MKFLEEDIRKKFLDMGPGNEYDTLSASNKIKNKQDGMHQTKNLHRKKIAKRKDNLQYENKLLKLYI